jgi:hypothetical protein
MSFTLPNFTVTRHGIQKNHGSLIFTQTSAGSTTGTVMANTNNHHAEGPFAYALGGTNGTILSITLHTHLVLSGNSSTDINYSSWSGVVTGLTSSNTFTGARGALTPTSADNHLSKRGDDDDTWTAAASMGDDAGHEHHGGHRHEAGS